MATSKNKATFAAEVSYDTSAGDGTYQAFTAALSENAAALIFDNQSNVAVTISDDGTTNGKTFSANSAIVLDLRSNKLKIEDDFSFPISTQFYGKSAAGTGSFYISTIYAS